ncbi:hypothetical protein I302_105793 [Kwoniella bestiolae CBS 10118]|uniref:ubiquitinyl hydrolase 1 n=1 Tax=Kwoniella bestiolae CBS 10118 TaxID=1296100 RepID=A0A1B9G259_9TREE|nr:hypothetical protein I302_04914 [Kwoniella bestiolae CBS 10118]OCF25104.1 hypothetical protein I302_04914 [Kwoniella bestiolae CBS 10118]
MTSDKPPHHTSPKSPRSPIRSHSLNTQQPYKHHSLTDPTSPSSSTHKSHPHSKPAGPRSPEHHRSPRDGPGSSRTKYRTVPILSQSHDAPIIQEDLFQHPSHPISSSPPTLIFTEDAPHAPYRPPEAVIEPPEEHPPGYTPGIVAEHIGSDDDMGPPPESPTILKDSQSTLGADQERKHDIDSWKADVKSYPMDVDPSTDEPSRPPIGRGILPRRLLQIIHEHDLVQPNIVELPQPSKRSQGQAQTSSSASAWNGSNKNLTSSRPASIASSSGLVPPPSPSPSTASMRSLPDSERISTLDDVWDALPGQKEGHGEWYFCTTCWGWLRITAGSGEVSNIPNMEEWESSIRSNVFFENKEEYDKAYNDRLLEYTKYNDLRTSRLMAEETHHHLHGFLTLTEESLVEKRIERVEVDEKMNVFPHITFGLQDEENPNLLSFDKLQTPSRLFLSCSSDLWVKVDRGLVPGQIPLGLVQAFTSEKMSNPAIGHEGAGANGVSEAWTLLTTLLMNPLFKGQRGWVKLDNPKFQKQIGASMTSSHLLYQIGFACQQEEDGLRVGPFKVGDEPSEEDKRKQRQMDQYMIRAWVEITLYLIAYQQRNKVEATAAPFIQSVPLEERLDNVIQFNRYPEGTTAYSDTVKTALFTLGVTKQDRAQTVEIAYGLQISCDPENTPAYLSALEKIAEAPIYGRESLQMRVALERSLDKYTSDDLERAYNAIGYTAEHAEILCTGPEGAPDSHILDLHKAAVQAASTAQEKQDLARALVLIGRARKSDLMKQLGENGQTLMSVQEAYSALNCPEDAIDDGLLMQYEMAVNEYPGKADHYRNCLSIIADAPGRERPGIKTFLQTGSREPEAPPRKDIPVGLHNIGYLNSILQYLYSIKPLRDAVISFEQDQTQPITAKKADVERSKRFVRQLRLLFLQLYKSETSSVRPDEELAYLAITRPEVDAIVEPRTAPQAESPKNKFSLDDIPDIPDVPSPSSTQVATPISSPDLKPVQVESSTSTVTVRDDRESSVLGKRASEDRDDSSSPSSGGVIRHKSDDQVASPMEVDDFELVSKPGIDEPVQADSPSATMDLGHLDLKSPIPESKEEFIPQQQEEEVKYASPSVPPPLPPRPQLAKKDTLSSGLRFGLQQDSAEVLINVLSQLELALDQPSDEDGEKGSNLIQSLFSCKYKQQIIYETSLPSRSISSGRRESITYEAQKPVESVFVHPIIGVEEEGKDLSDCLAELYLKGADIEYEGKKGYMMDLMDEFPDMLYIQMRRSQYDPATGRERKTNTHIPFGQTLSMGRFLVGADPQKREEAIEVTREMVRVRSRLHQLRNHKPLSIPDTFKHVTSSLRHLTENTNQSELYISELSEDLTPDLLQGLENELQSVENEITQLHESLPKLKSRMDEIWSDTPDEWTYELVSVFMHRGKNSGSGHYWTYQSWLPDHSDTFFKYNDETVTQVPSSEVLADRTGDDANPALLCYVRKGKRLVDTLHREVLELQMDTDQLESEGKDEDKVEEEGNLIDL